MEIDGVKFKIGADPELFLKDTRTGRMVGAHGKVQGTKEFPHKLKYGNVQVDGMAMEFNTKPVSDPRFFGVGVQALVKEIDSKFLKPNHLQAVITPTVEFDEEEWSSMPYEAKELGCNADFNAWSGEMNPTPNAKVSFRSGAGHIHIGWGTDLEQSQDFFEACRPVIRECDATLGVMTILYDDDTRRRELYGKAGSFRTKSYGVEYRPPSNKWVVSGKLQSYVVGLINVALQNAMANRFTNSYEVEDIVNNNDVDEALMWAKHHNLPLPPDEHRVY
jgi:hypothetical protein